MGRIARWIRRGIGADCVLCGLSPGEPDLCRRCRCDFFAPRARCECCAVPMASPVSLCGACLHRTPHFDATLALADYAPPVDAMVLALKFARRLELAPILGELLADRLTEWRPAPALLVPVPLAFERLAERGFNQAREIARAAAGATGIELDLGLLVRVRHAPAQATLQLDARQRNIRGAFAVRRRVAGRHIGLVDDVMTTGSTLDEAARVLKGAGAERVTNLVVARTP